MTAIDAATPLGRHRRVATTLALLAGGALALTACGSGQISQTATQVAAVNGNSADVGDIQLRNVHVVYPNSQEYSIEPGGTVELGFTVFGCASTGNLGNSVAAHAARLGLTCYVFIPDNLEPGKVVGSGIYQPKLMAIRGNYDDVNRLCTQIADKYRWGFANINLRTYYAEGAKTFGFEIVEQLGWRLPQHVVSPVAGGTLLASAQDKARKAKLRVWEKEPDAPPPAAEGAEGAEEEEGGANGHAAGAEGARDQCEDEEDKGPAKHERELPEVLIQRERLKTAACQINVPEAGAFRLSGAADDRGTSR